MKYFAFGNSDCACCSVDWMQLTAHFHNDYTPDTEFPVTNDGLSYVRQTYGTNVFQFRDIVYNSDGVKLATCCYYPKNPNIKRDIITIQFSNQLCYCSLDTQEKLMKLLFNHYQCHLPSVSRVDLCCDFELHPHHLKVLYLLASGEAYVKSLRGYVAWWDSMSVGFDGINKYICPKFVTDKIPYTITFGSRQSVFKWKVYYKYKELEEVADKPYIREMWERHGLNAPCVWRCEVSINPSSNLLIGGGGCDWSQYVTDCSRFFVSLYNDKFEIRMAEGHKNKRRDTLVKFLCLDDSRKLFSYDRQHGSAIFNEPQIRASLWMLNQIRNEDDVSNSGMIDYYFSQIAIFCHDDSVNRVVKAKMTDSEYNLLTTYIS